MFRFAPMAVVWMVVALVVACGDGGQEAEITPSASATVTASPTAAVGPTGSVSPVPTLEPSQLGSVLEPVEGAVEDGYYVLDLETGGMWWTEVPLSGWSPDSRRLLSINCCIGGGGLDVVDVETGEAVRLIERDLSGAAWAPDGKTIAFSPYGLSEEEISGPSGIYLVDPAGGEIRLVSPSGDGPVWSADGRYLAYTLQGYVYVWDSELDTTDQVTEEVGAAYYVSRPVWSPTDPVLAFGGDYRKTETGPFRWPTYLYDANGHHLRELASDVVGGGPLWSPDGTQLLIGFQQVSESDWPAYRAIRVSDGSVSGGLEPARFPAWSPDGEWVSYISEGCETGVWDVYVSRPDGSEVRKLTDSPNVVKEGTAWTADGSAVIYRGEKGIEMIDVQTGEAEVLVSGLMHFHGDGFSPDGRYLVFYVGGGHGVCD